LLNFIEKTERMQKMKKIGRQVLMLATKPGNPRNGEGAFLRLNSGEILFAFTQYHGESRKDHATAQIACCLSSDEGETWTEPACLIPKRDDLMNVMSVSLLRLSQDEIGILYLEKRMKEGKILCMPVFRLSRDEGKNWSEEVNCIEKEGYYVVNNDRLVKLRSGRLIFPAAAQGEPGNPGVVQIYYSDDLGKTWQMLPSEVRSPYSDWIQLQEPGLYEYEDGSLWLYARTAYGHQYQSFSRDGGLTWTAPEPNLYFTSPTSPMQVKRLGDLCLAIFNPKPYTCVNTKFEWKIEPRRAPFVCAVSQDDGASFQRWKTGTSRTLGRELFNASCYYLEDDEENGYCYPALMEADQGASILVAYYHGNGSPDCLNSTKILKIFRDEL